MSCSFPVFLDFYLDRQRVFRAPFKRFGQGLHDLVGHAVPVLLGLVFVQNAYRHVHVLARLEGCAHHYRRQVAAAAFRVDVNGVAYRFAALHHALVPPYNSYTLMSGVPGLWPCSWRKTVWASKNAIKPSIFRKRFLFWGIQLFLSVCRFSAEILTLSVYQ